MKGEIEMRQVKMVAIALIMMVCCFYSLVSAAPTNEELAGGMLSMGTEIGSVKRGMLAMGGEIGSIKKQIATNSGASLSKDDVAGMLKRKASSKSLNALRDDMEIADAQATVRAFTTEAALLDAAGYSAKERLAFDKLDPVKDAVARRQFLAEAYKRLARTMALEMLTNPDADANKQVAQLFSQRVDEIVPKPEKLDLSGYALKAGLDTEIADRKAGDEVLLAKIPTCEQLSKSLAEFLTQKEYLTKAVADQAYDPKGAGEEAAEKVRADLATQIATKADGDTLDQLAGKVDKVRDATAVLAIGGHFGADKEAARKILGVTEKDAKELAKRSKELGLK